MKKTMDRKREIRERRKLYIYGSSKINQRHE